MRIGPREWLAAMLAVSIVATAASLNFSGIGPIGWRGMRLFPCELCWYQRILMYPIPVALGVGLWRRAWDVAWISLSLSALGVIVAAYHVLLQLVPAAEQNACFVGACTAVDYRFIGFTIPQMSLAAFALVAAMSAAAIAAQRRA